jgi:hypothetical protein
MPTNRIPGLDADDPAVSATIKRDVLMHDPSVVAEVLVVLGERFRGDWDLLMIAVPAGRADRVATALGLANMNGDQA